MIVGGAVAVMTIERYHSKTSGRDGLSGVVARVAMVCNEIGA